MPKNNEPLQFIFAGHPKSKERYDLVLFEVLERDEEGKPKIVKIHHDLDKQITIGGGEAFITGYIHNCALRSTTPPNDKPPRSVC
jgi:hypothetical protein